MLALRKKQYKYIPNYTLTHLRFKINFFYIKTLKTFRTTTLCKRRDRALVGGEPEDTMTGWSHDSELETLGWSILILYVEFM